MARLFVGLIALAAIAFVALAVYAYIGDLSPEQTEMRQPVTLDVSQ
jgi:hypothetical protein